MHWCDEKCEGRCRPTIDKDDPLYYAALLQTEGYLLERSGSVWNIGTNLEVRRALQHMRVDS